MFDAGGGFVKAFGSFGSGGGNLSAPLSVAFAPMPPPAMPPAPAPAPGNGTGAPPPVVPPSGNGTAPANYSRIAVVDRVNDRILLFNATGGYVSQFGSAGSGPGALIRPGNIAWSPDGNRFAVADSGPTFPRVATVVKLFNATGGYVSQFGLAGFGDGVFRLADIAWSPDGDRIAVSDDYGHRILLFNATGGYVSQFGELGRISDGQMYQPTGVDWSPDGDRIAVAVHGNDRVQLFNATGGYVGQFTMPNHGSYFNALHSVAWSPDGDRIAVLGSDAHLFNATGGHVGQFGASELGYLYGVDWSPDGDRIAVLDISASRIDGPRGLDVLISSVKLFNATGGYVGQFGALPPSDVGSSYGHSISWSPLLSVP